VKKILILFLASASLVGMLTFVAAGSFKNESRNEIKNEQVTDAEALPAYEILATVRSMGLRTAGEPVRRGPYYVLHATDRRGTQMRVVADAQFGDILSVAPAINGAAQRYQRGPRIIQVPQAGAKNRDEPANDRASINYREEPDATEDDDDEEEAAPAPQRQNNPPQQPRAPRWQPRSDVTPQPAGPRRAVLSAPPPAEGPTPIRPISRLGSKTDPAGKFAQPRDANAPPLPDPQ
jgi:hypothetical protein